MLENEAAIQALAKEVEESGKAKLFEFNHQGQDFAVSITRVEVKDAEKGEYRISLSMIDDKGKSRGVISGLLVLSEKVFVSFSATNKEFEVNEADHVPGLVRESIVAMLSAGLFETWFSSMHHSEGGKKMYAYLGKDDRVSVTPSFEYDGQKRFKVILKRG